MSKRVWIGTIVIVVAVVGLGEPSVGGPGDGTACDTGVDLDWCEAIGAQQCDGGFSMAQGCPTWRATYDPGNADFLQDTEVDWERNVLYLLPDWEGRLLIGADTETGDEKWRVSLDDEGGDLWPDSIVALPTGGVAVLGEGYDPVAEETGLRVAIVSPTGDIVTRMFFPDGDGQWWVPDGGAVDPSGETLFVVAGDHVGDDDGVLVVAFDLSTGNLLWHHRDPTVESGLENLRIEWWPEGSGILVAGGDPEAVVRAYAATDGALLWSYDLPEDSIAIDLAAVPGRVVVLHRHDGDLRLQAFDPDVMAGGWVFAIPDSGGPHYRYAWSDRDYVQPYGDDILFTAPSDGVARAWIIDGVSGSSLLDVMGPEDTERVMGVHQDESGSFVVYGSGVLNRAPPLPGGLRALPEWNAFALAWSATGEFLGETWSDGWQPIFDDDVGAHFHASPGLETALLAGHGNAGVLNNGLDDVGESITVARFDDRF